MMDGSVVIVFPRNKCHRAEEHHGSEFVDISVTSYSYLNHGFVFVVENLAVLEPCCSGLNFGQSSYLAKG